MKRINILTDDNLSIKYISVEYKSHSSMVTINVKILRQKCSAVSQCFTNKLIFNMLMVYDFIDIDHRQVS